MITISSQDVFVFSEREAVLIRLPTFDWDFTLGSVLRLRTSGYSLSARQIGTGNHEGKATILLSLAGKWAEAKAVMAAILEANEPILLEQAAGDSGSSID